MGKIIAFIDWHKANGGNLANYNVELISQKIDNPILTQSSSFKNRATEIKLKYNHRFKLDHLHDGFLNNYPNIEKLNFERKL